MDVSSLVEALSWLHSAISLYCATLSISKSDFY